MVKSIEMRLYDILVKEHKIILQVIKRNDASKIKLPPEMIKHLVQQEKSLKEEMKVNKPKTKSIEKRIADLEGIQENKPKTKSISKRLVDLEKLLEV